MIDGWGLVGSTYGGIIMPIEMTYEEIGIWVGNILIILGWLYLNKLAQKKKHKRIYERVEELEEELRNFKALFYKFDPSGCEKVKAKEDS